MKVSLIRHTSKHLIFDQSLQNYHERRIMRLNVSGKKWKKTLFWGGGLIKKMAGKIPAEKDQ